MTPWGFSRAPRHGHVKITNVGGFRHSMISLRRGFRNTTQQNKTEQTNQRRNQNYQRTKQNKTTNEQKSTNNVGPLAIDRSAPASGGFHQAIVRPPSDSSVGALAVERSAAKAKGSRQAPPHSHPMMPASGALAVQLRDKVQPIRGAFARLSRTPSLFCFVSLVFFSGVGHGKKHKG